MVINQNGFTKVSDSYHLIIYESKNYTKPKESQNLRIIIFRDLLS